MTRFSLQREALAPTQREAFDAIAARRGRVPAPYAPLLASPAVADQFERFSTLLWEGRLTQDVRELVFLVTAQAWRCGHQWTTHEDKALQAGVPAAAIAAVRAGRALAPQEACARLRAAARLAGELQAQRTVPDAVFAEAAVQFDAAELAELLAFCTLAASVAMLLNAAIAG
jgi:4-carboxymuconolactone decarboxylase